MISEYIYIIWCSYRRHEINTVITQGCEQTLGLGLGQSKDIVVVFF